MSMQMGELAVIVDGKKIYSYKEMNGVKPTDAELLRIVTSIQAV